MEEFVVIYTAENRIDNELFSYPTLAQAQAYINSCPNRLACRMRIKWRKTEVIKGSEWSRKKR